MAQPYFLLHTQQYNYQNKVFLPNTHTHFYAAFPQGKNLVDHPRVSTYPPKFTAGSVFYLYINVALSVISVYPPHTSPQFPDPKKHV
jgi:hypothetical protein